MFNLIGAVLLDILELVWTVVSAVALAGLCFYLVWQVIASLVYWGVYISNKKRWPYTQESTERLWAYVLAASTAITMMLLFAFLRISDAAGFYLLWKPAAFVGYFVVAFVIATNLHNHWTDGAVW